MVAASYRHSHCVPLSRARSTTALWAFAHDDRARFALRQGSEFAGEGADDLPGGVDVDDALFAADVGEVDRRIGADRRLAVLHAADVVGEAATQPDDPDVRGAKVFAAAIDDRSHRLLARDVLLGDPGDAAPASGLHRDAILLPPVRLDGIERERLRVDIHAGDAAPIFADEFFIDR